MTARLAAVGLAAAALLAAVSGTAGSAPPSWRERLERFDWGRDLELSDLRHALDLHPPAAVERWLYNPRERTALGLRRLAAAGPQEALAAFETAGRIAPGDREVLLNLGTARLLADHGDAVGPLERALAGPPEETGLAPEARQRAFYNLGTARLAAGDAAGAVAALEEALRREPSDADAKFNLELALRRLAEERLKLRPPRETPGARRPGDEEESDEPGGTEPDPAPGDEERGGRDPGRSGAEAGSRPREDTAFGRRPLAGFEEQRDLTAAQAAALLDAVENLERRQRRLVAGRAARAAGAVEEDW